VARYAQKLRFCADRRRAAVQNSAAAAASAAETQVRPMSRDAAI